jgi:nucleotide-binding universal stress UspA family protein
MYKQLLKYIDQFIEALRAQGKEILDKARRVVFEHALKSEGVLLETIGGRAADQIVQLAKQCKADLIVMGTHGRRGLRRLTLGSDAELVVRSSPVPVLLVRGAAKDSSP